MANGLRTAKTILAAQLLIGSLCFLAPQTVTRGEPQLKDIEFVARHDGSTQRYLLVLPADFQAEKPHDLLIALHGHGSDRQQFVNSDRDECRATRDAAAKHAMLYVSPDYRATTSWMGPAAEADMVQIIEELKKQYKIERTFVSGASMGGFAALTFAVLHPDLIAGLAAQNGTANHREYENFQAEIQESVGGSNEQVPHEYKKRSKNHLHRSCLR